MPPNGTGFAIKATFPIRAMLFFMILFWLNSSSLLHAQTPAPKDSVWTPVFISDTTITSGARKSPILSRQLQTSQGEKIYSVVTTYIDTLTLPDRFIFQNSARVFLDGQPANERLYKIDYHEGRVFTKYLFSDNRPHSIEVRYRSIPVSLQLVYFKRTLAVKDSSIFGDTLKMVSAKTQSSGLAEDIFSGTSLRKSGTIVRGISVGTNQDLTVNSGLRLQLEGSLAPGVNVTAALTDENTPIQAEGNTQTLQEFDRVFVEIESEHAKATIGDFNLSLDNSEFASLDRKLQGGQISANLDVGRSHYEGLVSVAFSRGKYNVNQFNGLDGVQGPYRLTNQDGEPLIVVLAGTEKVYVDGELQTRGQNNDYVIEYSSGEITFTSECLITSDSRIVVDFQYTENLYPRSFFGTQFQSLFLNDKVKIQATFLNESDDKDNPIDITLSEANIETLKAAGADKSKAIDTTAFAGKDSDGSAAGNYIRKDTLIDGETIQIYRYAPSSDSAYWSPSFSYVDDGTGSYEKISYGIYEYVGEGNGDYEAYYALPLPQSQSLFDLAVLLQPHPFLTVKLEGALSENDLNTFSALDDSLKGGNAYLVAVQYAPKQVRVGGKNIGDFDIQVSQRYTSQNFAFFDRTQSVEFERDYNLIDSDGDELVSEDASQTVQKASFGYSPITPLQIKYTYGELTYGELLFTTRQEINSQLSLNSGTTSSLTSSFVESENTELDEYCEWNKHTGTVQHKTMLFERRPYQMNISPFVNYEINDKTTRSIAADTLDSDSHHIINVEPGITISNFFGQEFSFSFTYRTDKLFYSDTTENSVPRLEQASVAKTFAFDWQPPSSKVFTTKLKMTYRLREFTERFRLLGNSNSETILFRLQTRYSPWNGAFETELLYNVSTEKVSKTDRLYVAVDQGDGSYIWEDANDNGLKEFSEYVPISYTSELGDDSLQYVLTTYPSDELVPVIDLTTNLRFRIRPFRVITSPHTFLEKAAEAISTETLFRIEESSTEEDLKQIYLLNLSKFQNDSTTVSGQITFQQDVHFYENKLTNVRLRYQQQRSLSQYTLGIERKLYLERSLRFVTRLGYELGFEFNVESSYNRNIAVETDSEDSYGSTGREYEITSYLLGPDISYRPVQDLELGLEFEYERRADEFAKNQSGGKLAEATLTTLKLSSSYSLRGKGLISARISRTETRLKNTDDSNAVYELTSGNSSGNTYIWRLNFDYRLSRYITSSLNYEGRAVPSSSSLIHTATAEIRAVF
ncbi:hypothetical protein Ctha_1480 [Chloroherpeton thalassium ATCC 35110]|uniref:Uncharacterized protein n=2 Tax=Chloroherpeton thalassium TaxID=100716 RepID=B3QRY6_CHLT3|nr:hypothetical protein Ctha_1480 [Chloroherpeton thalassium ATCC 35110]